ncbi:MAG TPA: LuxR C-terminal-related transcriptional regulator [Syntrophales bacterium]|nr:LuxR C-terminal-related transcriptional regulator [Syntrophales bacterium]
MPLSARDYKRILEIIDIMYSEHDKSAMFSSVFDCLHKFIGIYDAAFFPFDSKTGKFYFIGYRSYSNPRKEPVLCPDGCLNLDPLVAYELIKNANTVVHNTDLLQWRSLTTGEFVRDFFARVTSAFYALASSLVVEGDVLAICSFHRKKRDGDFTKREKDVLNKLLPHMANALRNHHFMNGIELNKHVRRDNSEFEDSDQFSLNENLERLLKGIRLGSVPNHNLGSYPAFFQGGLGTYRGLTLPASADKKVRLTHHEASSSSESINQKLDMHKLTRREKELTILVLKGYSNRNIAESLHISEQTVKDHLHNIFGKLGIKRRSELAARALGFKNDFIDFTGFLDGSL